tara:strand:+ start:4449 stop:4637 length:189 start_codon:yes stop_codon:yes gene_type:complete
MNVPTVWKNWEQKPMSNTKESYRERVNKPVFRYCPSNPKQTLRNTSEDGNAIVVGTTEDRVV